MRYQLALEIHERIEEVRRLIKTGEYSPHSLAEAVGVSIPTISRLVAALRKMGHAICVERTRNGWHYLLEHPAKNEVDGVRTQNQRHPKG